MRRVSEYVCTVQDEAFSCDIPALSSRCHLNVGLTVSVTRDAAYWLDMLNNYCPVAIKKTAELQPA